MKGKSREGGREGEKKEGKGGLKGKIGGGGRERRGGWMC